MVIECLASWLVLNGVLAVWVVFDSRQRGANPLALGFATLVMGPIMLPLYRARRPLHPAEVRDGGPDWIVAANFAWLWTVYMAVGLFWVILTVTHNLPPNDDPNRPSAIFGRGLAVIFITVCCWILPAGAALFLSIVLHEGLSEDHEPAT